ncbi:hypothetical protein [Nafulsella turpanensis]|uniref:hypothetical protein n=1 Tax=Nafulsella turpanensis TaxID=1265690 RepID=UPI000347F374|nr:hypothetical protein [Nafulsella turpanensis]
MQEFNLPIRFKAKDTEEAKAVQKALENMIISVSGEGVIKMNKLFNSDPLVRNLVKIKLGIR